MYANLIIVAVFVIGIVSLGAATDWLTAFTTETARKVSVESAPRALPPIILEDQEGGVFKLSDFKNQVVLVQFIYTQCPTVCTQLGDTFEYLADSLPSSVIGKRIKLVSISFDWEKDTQQARSEYAEARGALKQNWKIARPILRKDTASLLKVFGVTAIPDEFGGYVHNGGVHFIGQDGRFSKIYDATNPVELTTELERILWKQTT